MNSVFIISIGVFFKLRISFPRLGNNNLKKKVEVISTPSGNNEFIITTLCYNNKFIITTLLYTQIIIYMYMCMFRLCVCSYYVYVYIMNTYKLTTMYLSI